MTYLERADKLLKTPYSRLWRIDVRSPHDTTYVVALAPTPDWPKHLLHIRVQTVSQMEVARGV